MNDWWDYLEHGWFGKSNKGKEMPNHRYYARVATGTDKNGNTRYRYFYKKDDYAAYIRSGKKKLTGKYGMEHHPNGRTAWIAEEQYTDANGKLQTRKKYVTAEVANRLRDDAYRKERVQNETAEEKKKRMNEAKKRYNKKCHPRGENGQSKRALRLWPDCWANSLLIRKKPESKQEARQRRKSGWSQIGWSDFYIRKLPKNDKK